MTTPAITGIQAYTDEQVIDLVVQGHIEMYELLMRRYNQRLFRVTRAILRNEDEARDVVQDAYVRAYLHLTAFRRESSVATWLTRIAVHEALSRARRYGLYRNAAAESMIPKGKGIESDPEQVTAQRQLRKLLEKSIEELPIPCRMAFVLRHVEGLSVQETAECLQISEEAARVRTHRARIVLRKTLKDKYGLVSADAFPLHLTVCDANVAGTYARIKGRTDNAEPAYTSVTD